MTFTPSDWRSCEAYLYGIDLFNHGFWWEAHEALEAVWVAAGRRTRTGLFVQGLIQIAVAHLKQRQGFHGAAARMASAGLDKMRPADGVYLGIDVGSFRDSVEAHFSGDSETPAKINLVM